MYYKLRLRNRRGDLSRRKYSAGARCLMRPRAIARHRREGGGYLIEHRLERPRVIKATPPPPPSRRRPSLTPKMVARFLETVRNRRVNIGRSISVFGRVEKRRWHAVGNTGVMQRHTQPQKSRATHPRRSTPTPLSAAPSYPSPSHSPAIVQLCRWRSRVCRCLRCVFVQLADCVTPGSCRMVGTQRRTTVHVKRCAARTRKPRRCVLGAVGSARDRGAGGGEGCFVANHRCRDDRAHDLANDFFVNRRCRHEDSLYPYSPSSRNNRRGPYF